MLGIEDRMAIHELLALYGHLIDERRWDELDQVFTADAVYDGTDFGMPVTRSLAELLAEWTSEVGLTRHPLAHHATNIVITAREDGTALVRSKGPRRRRRRARRQRHLRGRRRAHRRRLAARLPHGDAAPTGLTIRLRRPRSRRR